MHGFIRHDIFNTNQQAASSSSLSVPTKAQRASVLAAMKEITKRGLSVSVTVLDTDMVFCDAPAPGMPVDVEADISEFKEDIRAAVAPLKVSIATGKGANMQALDAKLKDILGGR